MTRAWFILAISNLVAILLLAVLAAIVYHRIAMDTFSPPVYSIWVKPGEIWHHVEFVISPTHGFDMTISGAGTSNHRNAGSPDARP
jgi:hypothetical protein